MNVNLRKIQNSMLTVIFRILSGVAAVALIAVIYEEVRLGSPSRIFIVYIPAFVLFSFAAFNKNLPYWIRVVVLLSALGMIGLSEFYYFGYSSHGFLFFGITVILSALMCSPRTGWFVFAGVCAVTLGFILAYVQGWIPFENQVQTRAFTPINWLSPTLSYMMLISGTLAVIGVVINNLKSSLVDSEKIRNQLEKEKEALSVAYEELEDVAFRDTVTGLPNNKKLTKDIGSIIASYSGEKYHIRQILIELLNFEEVNIKYGLNAGNEVLRLLAKRLQGIPGIRVYRMTGARFLVHSLAQGNEECASTLEDTKAQMLTALKEPVSLDNKLIKIHFQAAEVHYPDDVNNPTLLVPHLIMAMGDEDQRQYDSITRYNERYSEHIIRRNHIKEMLEEAIQKEELSVYIQPRMSLHTGRITGGELLLRWFNSPYGDLSPDEFIPIAEKEHLIDEITHTVFRASSETVEFISAHHHSEEPFSLSVNISPSTIQSNKLHEFIKYTTQLPPNINLEFELTEGVFLGLNDTIWKELNSLHKNNISISVDDFGTGYSNIGYLHELNIDVLKIDKRFIEGIPHNEKQMHIVLAIINMAKALKLKTIAEGVEYREQLEWLKQNGVDEIQGFLFAHPMGCSEFKAFLLEQSVQMLASV